MKRVLITCTAIAVLGLALAASRRQSIADSITVRIDNAFHDLARAGAPIPHEALHAKALEILRGRTVAEDDESCPVFNLTPESYNPCKGEPK